MVNTMTLTKPVAAHGQPMAAVWEYRRHQVEGAGPLQRIIIVYDVALRACAQRDLARGTAALRVLEDGLNFSAGQVAANLFSIYQYTADLMRSGNYDHAASLLRELRDAWAEAQVKMANGKMTHGK